VTIKLGKIGCKFYSGEFRRGIVRSDRDNYSTWGFIKVTCLRCDVNFDKGLSTVNATVV